MESKKFYGGLWIFKGDKPNSPKLTGSVELDGKKFQISVFKNVDRTNRKPDYNLVLQEQDQNQNKETKEEELE